MQLLPILKLKFLDECHFDSKELTIKRGVSLRGRAVQGVLPPDWNKRYSLTLLTSLDVATGCVVSNLRTDSNKALDFLQFVADLMNAGHLAAGDIVV